MLKLGEKQTLIVEKVVRMGVFMTEKVSIQQVPRVLGEAPCNNVQEPAAGPSRSDFNCPRRVSVQRAEQIPEKVSIQQVPRVLGEAPCNNVQEPRRGVSASLRSLPNRPHWGLATSRSDFNCPRRVSVQRAEQIPEKGENPEAGKPEREDGKNHAERGRTRAEKRGGDSGAPQEHVLLPSSQVPEGTKPGDALEVFLYKDSEDRLIATRKEPKLKLHEVGFLTVRDTGAIGAFLDWGLDKDLLLPFREQPREHRVQKGESVLCAVYIDRSGRLAATMNVYPYLRQDSPYRAGDEVTGTAYETSNNFGLFVAVDNCYSALIPKKELVREIHVGETVEARVTRVRDDGRLDLSLRGKAWQTIEDDAERILSTMRENGGALPFTDKADPELIRREMGMSKAQFKRAVGHLLKEGRIEIGAESICERK